MSDERLAALNGETGLGMISLIVTVAIIGVLAVIVMKSLDGVPKTTG
jgi:Tfp pilus assembly protein PilE